jgi:glucose/arabinose dehydrogenase
MVPNRPTGPKAALAAGLAGILLLAAPAAAAPRCDDDDGGIRLAEGFCALVMADGVGRARHLVVEADGDVYVRLREASGGGSIVALRDEDGDGRADRIERFDEAGGTGIGLRDGWLYVSTNREVYRWRLPAEGLVPEGEPELVVKGFPRQRGHAAKPFAFDGSGGLYVTVGSPSNACQEDGRGPGSPGVDPCPERDEHAGIWRFEADATYQDFEDGERYAAGIRNAVALAWNRAEGALYVMQHGRDLLAQNWPDRFTFEQSAELPAEEMQRLTEGADFGWPYCYYDHLQGRRVLAPEYGGDGREVGRCAAFAEPVAAYPGHYAPNALLFYRGGQFGEAYRGGAFIAFHGSWNRAPLEQRGYLVAFQPFENGRPTRDWQVFADGFAAIDPIERPADARFRPMGLAEGPDGSLYISDSVRGRIWRVMREAD